MRWESMTRPCASSNADALCGAVRAECGMRGETATLTFWRREGTTDWGVGRPSCNGDTPPPPPEVPADAVIAQAPPTPSFAQIQSAFEELPFCMPKPSMQPVGGRTLVNLPTFYQVTWPDDAHCLRPGKTSEPVQLLSWSIDFKVEPHAYLYWYGDGQTSGWTTSPGGTHPDGDITHTYETTGDKLVKVDARLTGSYRVNGGDWQDIDTIANLQDEPNVPYEVVEAKNRLVS